jgi:hypothetical protein
MNAIVEVPRGKLTPVKDPELEALAWKAKAAELKRQLRELKAELKEERRHTVDMLAIMRRMSHRSIVCECDICTCTPTRADMLRRR